MNNSTPPRHSPSLSPVPSPHTLAAYTSERQRSIIEVLKPVHSTLNDTIVISDRDVHQQTAKPHPTFFNPQNPTPTATTHSATVTAAAAHANTTADITANATAPKPRKRKAPDPSDAPKEKKPRKPRITDPNGKPATAKNSKDAATAGHSSFHRNATLPIVSSSPHPTTTKLPSGKYPFTTSQSVASRTLTPQTLSNNVGASSQPATSGPQPRPPTSGQRYDPIRGLTMDDSASSPVRKSSPLAPALSRSPTVASLMNPVDLQAEPKPLQPVKKLKEMNADKAPANTSTSQKFLGASISAADREAASSGGVDGAKDQTSRRPGQFLVRSATEKYDRLDKTIKSDKADKDEVKSTASLGPTPKSKRLTPPSTTVRATGSGLLSTSDLFGGSANNTAAEQPVGGVTIDFRVTLNPEGTTTINIAQEIIKRYGREALNPRATAHRERLLQVAAAANRLDQGSGDEMSLDMSDPENESNVDVGGSREDKGAESSAPTTKKRARRKVEEYNKEDDFIDDTELAWEQQAAVARDGFFVYSGPLVPEEDKAEGVAISKGKGRGRGGKAKANGEGKSTVSADGSAAPEKARKKPGPKPKPKSANAVASKKPRAIKADKEHQDAEK